MSVHHIKSQKWTGTDAVGEGVIWDMQEVHLIQHLIFLARAHLRQGAKVLVDPEDQVIFDDVLEGRITEPTSASE